MLQITEEEEKKNQKQKENYSESWWCKNWTRIQFGNWDEIDWFVSSEILELKRILQGFVKKCMIHCHWNGDTISSPCIENGIYLI